MAFSVYSNVRLRSRVCRTEMNAIAISRFTRFHKTHVCLSVNLTVVMCDCVVFLLTQISIQTQNRSGCYSFESIIADIDRIPVNNGAAKNLKLEIGIGHKYTQDSLAASEWRRGDH